MVAHRMSSFAPPLPSVAPPLSDGARARGRRLAIASHPAGMTFTSVFTDNLPTLALVALGASETLVGAQSGLRSASQLLQLPTLRAVGRFSKRSILIAGHLGALLVSVPLLFFAGLAGMSSGVAIGIALGSFALTAAAINVSNAVWFPLLRGYVESDRIGSFFGAIRSGWHLALIAYFVGATFWLGRHADAFGPLFAVAWFLGLVRVGFLVLLPERDERTGERVRVREALALVRDQPLLRRFLLGVGTCSAVRNAAIPFAIVMLRREIGFTSAEVIYTTIAAFAGGLVSLYVWGQVVDRASSEPVFRWTSLGLAALYLTLLLVDEAGPLLLGAMVAFFFAHAVFSAGYGVAETRTLFELAPPEAPARTLVVSGVLVHIFAGASPVVAGLSIDMLLQDAASPLRVYHGFFAVASVLQVLSFLPLRAFAERAD